MPTTITATELRRRFSHILQQLAEQDDPVIITRYGQPAAVLMSMEQYERLRGNSDPIPDWKKQVLEVRRVWWPNWATARCHPSKILSVRCARSAASISTA